MSGKRDRPSGFQIDEKTLEYKDTSDKQKQQVKSTPEEISQRKIFKITGANQSATSSGPRVKFNMTFSEQKGEKKAVQNQIGNDKNQGAKQTKTNGNQKPEEQKSNDKKVQQKPQISFFGGSTFNFSFGQPFGNFGNSSSAPATGEGLFSKKSNDGSKPIFGTPKFQTGSNSVFNFKSQGVPPIKKQNYMSQLKPQQGDQCDSEQLQREQNMQIDPTKSSGKYQYQAQCEILFQNKALKMKKNNGDLIENIDIIIEKQSEKGHVWLISKLSLTKNTIVSGLIVKGASEAKNLNNKDENVCVSILVPPKENQKQDTKFSKIVLKIQFQQSKVGKQLIQLISGIVKKE